MKVLIIGNSGSGKTFKANELSKTHNIPMYELDNIMWMPNGYNEKKEGHLIQEEIQKIKSYKSWIVEGVFGDLAGHFVNDATHLIWLDKDWKECHSNLIKRGPSYDRYSNPRDAEKAFNELLDWASKYWERESSCSYSFHKKMAETFQKNKSTIEKS